ncbi:MAG TPA: hypothetical protein PLZ03_15965 [Anaerolineales bacterium]|nr:hypothetical protein [Anaerolineales bacterium]
MSNQQSSIKYHKLDDIFPFFKKCWCPWVILCEISNFLNLRLFNEAMTEISELSALECLLLGLDAPPKLETEPLRKDALCPQCHLGRLDYNGLLQLECPACGYVNGEGGGCT